MRDSDVLNPLVQRAGPASAFLKEAAAAAAASPSNSSLDTSVQIVSELSGKIGATIDFAEAQPDFQVLDQTEEPMIVSEEEEEDDEEEEEEYDGEDEEHGGDEDESEAGRRISESRSAEDHPLEVEEVAATDLDTNENLAVPLTSGPGSPPPESGCISDTDCQPAAVESAAPLSNAELEPVGVLQDEGASRSADDDGAPASPSVVAEDCEDGLREGDSTKSANSRDGVDVVPALGVDVNPVNVADAAL